MNAPNSYAAPFDQPCKDCGGERRRYRITHTQSGPATTWSHRAALYCHHCAQARLKAAGARFDAKLAAARR